MYYIKIKMPHLKPERAFSKEKICLLFRWPFCHPDKGGIFV
jgi:hypothetical protein